jgi:uncharacterized protein (TIGR02594 family)
MKSINDLPWMIIAQKYIGLHEGTSLKANPAVVKFFSESGHPEIKNDHTTPWCAAFVGAVLEEAGIKNTGSLLALSYSKYGHKLNKPIAGCIATKKRTGGGHVFFVMSFDDKYVYGLGGNQNDQVSIERFPRSVIYSYTWPEGVAIPDNVINTVVVANTSTNVKET